VRIAEIMNWKAISLKPDDPIQEAAELMSKDRLGGLPVVDDQGATFGALADADPGTVSRGERRQCLVPRLNSALWKWRSGDASSPTDAFASSNTCARFFGFSAGLGCLSF